MKKLMLIFAVIAVIFAKDDLSFEEQKKLQKSNIKIYKRLLMKNAAKKSKTIS